MDSTVHHECAFSSGSAGNTWFRDCVFLLGADCSAGYVDEWSNMKLNFWFWEIWLLFAVVLLGRPWSQIELAFIGVVLAVYLAIKAWKR